MKLFYRPTYIASLSLLGCLGLAASACSGPSQKSDPSAAAQEESAETVKAASKEAVAAIQAAAPTLDPPTKSDLELFTADIEGDGPLTAAIKTDLGTIHCALFEAQAPIAVANFVGLATGQKTWVDPNTGHEKQDTPFYDGSGFYRVIPHFFVQAGDPTSTGVGGPGYLLPDEISDELSHAMPGTLSMANRGEPHSAGSQWFITVAPIPHLNGRHTIFGQCENLDVVRSIATVPTGPDDRPQDPPKILNIEFSRGDAS